MKSFNCFDCDVDIRKNKKDFYMVHDHLWNEFGLGKKYLCWNCFENRLGRSFTIDDFTDAFCNKKVNPLIKNLFV